MMRERQKRRRRSIRNSSGRNVYLTSSGGNVAIDLVRVGPTQGRIYIESNGYIREVPAYDDDSDVRGFYAELDHHPDQQREETEYQDGLHVYSLGFVGSRSGCDSAVFSNLQHGQEGLLRDLDLSNLLHALLAGLLFLQQFALARDIATVTLRRHILAQRLHS